MAHKETVIGCGLILTVFLLDLISTVSVSWLELSTNTHTTLLGLWTRCDSYNNSGYDCTDLHPQSYNFTHATRVFMVISCVVGLIIFILSPQIYREPFGIVGTTTKWVPACMCGIGEFNTWNPAFFITIAMPVIIGTTIYLIQSEKLRQTYHIGYSIILGWISIPLSLIGGCVLRRASTHRTPNDSSVLQSTAQLTLLT